MNTTPEPRKLRSGHTCHATGREESTDPKMFACRRHWFLLPKSLRQNIYRTYRPGQCDDWKPSTAYCKAAIAAVMWLGLKEDREPDTRLYDFFIQRGLAE